jgi:hypothetical protein
MEMPMLCQCCAKQVTSEVAKTLRLDREFGPKIKVRHKETSEANADLEMSQNRDESGR